MIICLYLTYNFYSSRLTPKFSRGKKLLHVFWNTLYSGTLKTPVTYRLYGEQKAVNNNNEFKNLCDKCIYIYLN